MRRLDRAHYRLGRALRAGPAFPLLCAAYAVAVLVIMMPALVSSVGADDMYFVLHSIDPAGRGPVDAVTGHLGDLFVQDTTGSQPRTVPLAITARRILAVIVLSLAVTFSIPIAAVWGAAKIAFLALTVASVAALLVQVRFATRRGEVRGLRRSTMAFLVLALPLATALGAKAQVIGGLNGWIHYPVLTLTAVPTIFLTAALCLWLMRKLHGDYRRWLVRSVVLLLVVAVILNYSYEFVAVAIPVAALAIVLQWWATRTAGFSDWKPAATVGAALVGGFTVLFLFNRWRLSQWDCVQDGTCYGGSFLDFDPLTLVMNFAGALPSSVTPTIESVMQETGRELPPAITGWGGLVGVAAVALLGAAWAAVRAREARRQTSGRLRDADLRESVGLLMVLAISGVTALGVSLVSGLTSRAIGQVQTPEMPYRSGPAVWTALALVLVILFSMLFERLPAAGRQALTVVTGTVVVLAVTHLLPLNLAVAQAERAMPRAQAVDAIHWDVVLGDLTPRGDAQRCSNAARYTSVVGSSGYFDRTIDSAEVAFEYLYGVAYCSQDGDTND